MKQLLLTPFLLGFISPVFADSWKDIEDLTKLIESKGTKIIERNNCKENNLGHYSSKGESDGVLTICLNNISEDDPSEYWEVLAHEAAHAMQTCNNNTLWQSKYHPRMLRALKAEAPHYAEILKQYRGKDKIFELEAFDMELQTPSEVKYNYKYYCLNNQNDELIENPVLTDENISLLYDLVGGKDAYDELVTWGMRNYSEDEIKKFDEIIDNGSFEDLKKSILNLNERYIQSNSQVKDLSAENNQEGLTDDEVNILKNLVGGEKSYDTFVAWALKNLSKEEQLEYDQLVDSGDFEKVKSKMLYYFGMFQDSQSKKILNAKEIKALQDHVGGSKKYDELMEWSRENLSVEEVTKFDEIINRKDFKEIKETLSKLKNKYNNWAAQFNLIKVEAYKPWPGKLNIDPDIQVPNFDSVDKACINLEKRKSESTDDWEIASLIRENASKEFEKTGKLKQFTETELNIFREEKNSHQREVAVQYSILRLMGVKDWREYSSWDINSAEFARIKKDGYYRDTSKFRKNDPRLRYSDNYWQKPLIDIICDPKGYKNIMQYNIPLLNTEEKKNYIQVVEKGNMKERYDLFYKLREKYRQYIVMGRFTKFPIKRLSDGKYYIQCKYKTTNLKKPKNGASEVNQYNVNIGFDLHIFDPIEFTYRKINYFYNGKVSNDTREISYENSGLKHNYIGDVNKMNITKEEINTYSYKKFGSMRSSSIEKSQKINLLNGKYHERIKSLTSRGENIDLSQGTCYGESSIPDIN
ncbi:hypothetical protein HA150_06310 [Prochlorococcus marinus XMU1414]|uniref:Uncharacterized protein n=1 Tax=Prochlorococcus marinus XMU1424 TaxID=2774497 RepID=A0A9D9BYY0_PROMR|nr:hypothetical protein [Prochlorococcus marinus]MBO8228512.1 hypothetical protein [Prochlorococcus marinus XMU1414]MBW3045999.1 hypothetical protein [Prochlorococcus marinus str. MU1414]MCR8531716.1 hypothetical protein [Prochlorococcus marinus XMU1420]MCR8535445.1 hypothetical protein [Prochlorococcus marinus XMU1424]